MQIMRNENTAQGIRSDQIRAFKYLNHIDEEDAGVVEALALPWPPRTLSRLNKIFDLGRSGPEVGRGNASSMAGLIGPPCAL